MNDHRRPGWKKINPNMGRMDAIKKRYQTEDTLISKNSQAQEPVV